MREIRTSGSVGGLGRACSPGPIPIVRSLPTSALPTVPAEASASRPKGGTPRVFGYLRPLFRVATLAGALSPRSKDLPSISKDQTFWGAGRIGTGSA
jgi:hypothetical protein